MATRDLVASYIDAEQASAHREKTKLLVTNFQDEDLVVDMRPVSRTSMYLQPFFGLGGATGMKELTIDAEGRNIVVLVHGTAEKVQHVQQQLKPSGFTINEESFTHTVTHWGRRLVRSVMAAQFSDTVVKEPPAPAPAAAAAPAVPAEVPLVEPQPAELGPDAPVAAIASRISALSRLSDRQLAAVFRVSRETFQRWRTGELHNPTIGNRRRLGLVQRLLDDLAKREINVHEWLLNVTAVEGLTPYELLAQGRIDEAENLAAAIGPIDTTISSGLDGLPVVATGVLAAFVPRSSEPAEDYVLEDDDDGWAEVETENVTDED